MKKPLGKVSRRAKAQPQKLPKQSTTRSVDVVEKPDFDRRERLSTPERKAPGPEPLQNRSRSAARVKTKHPITPSANSQPSPDDTDK